MIKVSVVYPATPGAHAKALVADTPNHTDIAPVMQISEVVDIRGRP